MAIERILIIDDDIYLCDEFAESLKSEGYSVDYTDDPFKGEELIRSGGYDAILLDYRMPVITGIDILRNLKTDNIKKRIFIVTGRPSVEQVLREENLSDMVSGIFKKPIDFEYLLKSLNKATS